MTDLESLLDSAMRHWRAVLLVLLITIAGVLRVPHYIESSYEASGSVILLSPPSVATAGGDDLVVNPWARFGGAESGAAAALVKVLQSGTTEALITTDNAVKSYGVAINRGNGAIIELSVTASSGRAALNGYRALADLVDRVLEERQAASGAPESTWMTTDTLTSDERARELPASERRAMAAVFGLGVVAALVLAVALDAVVNPRLESRRGAEKITRPDLAVYDRPEKSETDGRALVAVETVVEVEHRRSS